MYGDMYTGSMGILFLLVMIAVVLFYPAILFLGGLVLYYFTGQKPGGNILGSFMRVGMRLYAHGWMFCSVFLGFVGVYYFLNGLFGSFGSTTYGYGMMFRGGAVSQTSDLAMGFILLVVSAIIYFVHWVLAYMIENKVEKRGTLLTKLFLVAGLVVGGVIFWFSFISLVLSLVAVAGGAGIGGALALMLAAIPLWGYFLVKGWLVLKHEPGVREMKHRK